MCPWAIENVVTDCKFPVDMEAMRVYSFMERLIRFTNVRRVTTGAEKGINDVLTSTCQLFMNLKGFAILHLNVFSLYHVWTICTVLATLRV